MEDMKWFVKKFGIIFVILLVMIVSTGILNCTPCQGHFELV